MQTVTVGCKLPHGLLMELGGKAVQIAGKNSSVVIGGYGLTENIDAAFFNEWMARNKGLKFVQDGLIFAHEKKANVEAQANMTADAVTGFEAKDPENPAPGLENANPKKKKTE